MAIVAVAAFAGMAGAAATSVAVVAAVAAAVTVVGYVTESKTLMKIGAGLGLGGGVASAAGWSGTWATGAAATAETGAAAASTGAAEAGTGGTEAASNATGMATNSTGTSLRAAEGAAGVPYGTSSAAPVASGALRVTDVSAAAPNATPSGIIDAAAETSTMASPAEMAQIPGMATNSTGTTLRAMEGGSNAVYGGSSASGGSSYWDSLGDFWKGLDSGDKQIVGGIIKGVGQGAASYLGESMKTQSQIDAENRLRDNRSNFTPVRWSTR